MNRQILKKECIVTSRLSLHPYRQEDRTRLVEIMRNPEVSATFMVPDCSEESQWYALADKLIGFSQIEDTAHLEYGVYLDGCLIGFVNDCGYDDNSIEMGYVIDPAYKGQGFATEAVKAVIHEFREMGFKKVLARYFEGNIASLKVMEKCGMHPNGHSEEEEYRGKKLTCFECERDLCIR